MVTTPARAIDEGPGGGCGCAGDDPSEGCGCGDKAIAPRGRSCQRCAPQVFLTQGPGTFGWPSGVWYGPRGSQIPPSHAKEGASCASCSIRAAAAAGTANLDAGHLHRAWPNVLGGRRSSTQRVAGVIATDTGQGDADPTIPIATLPSGWGGSGGGGTEEAGSDGSRGDDESDSKGGFLGKLFHRRDKDGGGKGDGPGEGGSDEGGDPPLGGDEGSGPASGPSDGSLPEGTITPEEPEIIITVPGGGNQGDTSPTDSDPEPGTGDIREHTPYTPPTWHSPECYHQYGPPDWEWCKDRCAHDETMGNLAAGCRQIIIGNQHVGWEGCRGGAKPLKLCVKRCQYTVIVGRNSGNPGCATTAICADENQGEECSPAPDEPL